jgi:hypothetical protein
MNIVRDWALSYDSSVNLSDLSRINVLRDRRVLTIDILKMNLDSLVPVRVECKGNKGVIDSSTMIYLPTNDDLKRRRKLIVECRHRDHARIVERKMRKTNQSYRRGQTMVKLIEERSNDSEHSIIDDCDRKLLGAVTNGAFQFTRACCKGKGFIAAGGLLTLLKQQMTNKTSKHAQRVLIRMNSSSYYHWASLHFKT